NGRDWWTPARFDALRAFAAAGCSLRDAALELGCSRDKASGKAYREEIHFRKRLAAGGWASEFRWTREMRAALAEMARVGMSGPEIAERLGITAAAVESAAHRFRVKLSGRRGRRPAVQSQSSSSGPGGTRQAHAASVPATPPSAPSTAASAIHPRHCISASVSSADSAAATSANRPRI
ncbi:MAG: hypothetical protein ACREFZ_09520, partial [Acetobacteraceae bacterium]